MSPAVFLKNESMKLKEKQEPHHHRGDYHHPFKANAEKHGLDFLVTSNVYNIAGIPVYHGAVQVHFTNNSVQLVYIPFTIYGTGNSAIQNLYAIFP